MEFILLFLAQYPLWLRCVFIENLCFDLILAHCFSFYSTVHLEIAHKELPIAAQINVNL